MMTEPQIRDVVAGYLARQVRGVELDGDADIFGLGLVNSIFAMQIVLFVEKEFGITVDNDDLELDNFRSINAITGFVARKRAALAA